MVSLGLALGLGAFMIAYPLLSSSSWMSDEEIVRTVERQVYRVLVSHTQEEGRFPDTLVDVEPALRELWGPDGWDLYSLQDSSYLIVFGINKRWAVCYEFKYLASGSQLDTLDSQEVDCENAHHEYTSPTGS